MRSAKVALYCGPDVPLHLVPAAIFAHLHDTTRQQVLGRCSRLRLLVLANRIMDAYFYDNHLCCYTLNLNSADEPAKCGFVGALSRS